MAATGDHNPRTAADTLGAVVDGLVLTVGAERWDDDRRSAVAERTLDALFRLGPQADR